MGYIRPFLQFSTSYGISSLSQRSAIYMLFLHVPDPGFASSPIRTRAVFQVMFSIPCLPDQTLRTSPEGQIVKSLGSFQHFGELYHLQNKCSNSREESEYLRNYTNLVTPNFTVIKQIMKNQVL